MGVFDIKLSELFKRAKARKQGNLNAHVQTVKEWLDEGNEITVLPYSHYIHETEPFVPHPTHLESDFI